MHPIPAAQATVASLHALLPTKSTSSTQTKLIIAAIEALHEWASDTTLVPVRLRLRPVYTQSIQVKIRPPSSSSTRTKRGKRRRAEGKNRGRGRCQVSGKVPVRNPDGLSPSVDSQSQMPSSDLSTEPPEGWPRLSDFPSVELGETGEPESMQDDGKDVGEAETPAKRPNSDGKVRPRDRKEEGAVPQVRRVSKRRRVSPRNAEKIGKVEIGRVSRANGPRRSSQGHGSPNQSASVEETEKHDGNHLSGDKALNKRANRRKAVQKRQRRSTPTDQSLELSEEHDKPCAPNTMLESQPLSHADEPPPPAPQKENSELNEESPQRSVTQKSKEQDDGRSCKSSDRVPSFGSVVVGSASYDGSIDMRYRDHPHRGDVSGLTSPVWNGNKTESIEEPFTGDQSALQLDSIEETEKVPQMGLPESANSLYLSSDSLPHQETPKATPLPAKSDCLSDKKCLLDEDITSAKLHRGPGRTVVLRDLKGSSYTTPSPFTPGTHDGKLSVQTSTPSKLSPEHRNLDTSLPFRKLPMRISPVSTEGPPKREPPVNSTTNVEAHPPTTPSDPSEPNINEMIVCITSFADEIESELAHEIVMRLGGEIVTDFNAAHPECVVAPVDETTKEVVTREVVISLALASRVPVVGLQWLIQCFKSGCWVDVKAFETLSSRRKPSVGVFDGVVASFEDAFFRKNARKLAREYHDTVKKILLLAGGTVQDEKAPDISRSCGRFKLHIQISYDFENNSLDTSSQQQATGIPTQVVNKSWISACLFSGQCPPP